MTTRLTRDVKVGDRVRVGPNIVISVEKKSGQSVRLLFETEGDRIVIMHERQPETPINGLIPLLGKHQVVV